MLRALLDGTVVPGQIRYGVCMDMRLIDPPLPLAGRVIALWSLQGAPQGLYSGLPKPHVEFIVSLSGDHAWQADAGSPPVSFRLGWVTPIQTAPRFAQTHGRLHLIGARLSIQSAVALFGPAIQRDGATPVPLDALLGHEAALLQEQLLGAQDERQRMSMLCDWLQHRLMDCREIAMPTNQVLLEMRWRTDSLAEHMGLSPRGLRNRFHRQLGLSPKVWLRLHRFDAILSSGFSDTSLVDTALTFGYSDQAHMSSDFRQFAGRSPTDYVSSRAVGDAPTAAPHFVPRTD